MWQENTDTLPIDESLSLEQIIRRFEHDWQRGEPPALDAYVRLADVRVDRRALLLALVHVDLEHRLQRDVSVRVESYLERYPEISSDTTAIRARPKPRPLRRPPGGTSRTRRACGD